jgi:Rrf2 family protein
MRLTAQEEYGLRCLLQIARQPGGYMTIPEISARESLTAAYVGKLMRVLRKANLVESIRGQKGGYRLSKPPEQIDMATALDALGGRLFGRQFCSRFSGNGKVCRHDGDCSIRPFWSALDSVVQRALGRTTLRHLLGTERDMQNWTKTHLFEGDSPVPAARATAQ